jgi:hypothetical protein
MAFTVNLKNIRTIFGKTKTRSQMCLVATEDGRLLPVEIPVRKGCAADDDRISAWLIDHENQVKDEITGLWYQIVGERSSAPVCLFKQREAFKRPTPVYVDGKLVKEGEGGLKALIKGVFHDSWVTDLIMLNRTAAHQKRMGTIIMMLVSIPILAALVIAIKVIRG